MFKIEAQKRQHVSQSATFLHLDNQSERESAYAVVPSPDEGKKEEDMTQYSSFFPRNSFVLRRNLNFFIFIIYLHPEKHVFRVFYLFFNLWIKIYLTVNDGFDREL